MSRHWGLVFRALVVALFLGTAGTVPLAGPQVCGAHLGLAAAHEEPLRRFARSLGLVHVDAFVNLVRYVDGNAKLPDCYLTKAQAAQAGWSPGGRLWDLVPGSAMGGDRFGNRERRLPSRFNGRYLEADLDYDGGGRGPKRLVFVQGQPRSGLIWVTTDHYLTFQKVPHLE